MLYRAADNAGLSNDQSAWISNAGRDTVLVELSMDYDFSATDDLASCQHALWTDREDGSCSQGNRALFQRALDLDLRFFAEFECSVT